MSQWYLRTQDETFGPESEEKLVEWARLGRIQPGQEISEDNEVWRRVEDVPFLDMRFSIDLGDGNPRGPFNRAAAEALLASGRLPPTATMVESREPFDAPAPIDAPEPQSEPEPQPEPAPQVATSQVESEPKVVEKIVEAVTEQIVITPGLTHGDGNVRIVLKPTVLDGSEISMTAKDGALSVAIVPATPDAGRLAAAALPRLEAALAEHVTAFRHIAVAVISKKGKSDETA